MPSLSTIIDYCISVNNKSGSIPPAPQGLKKLKESIEGVPFELLQKGMSGIFQNLMGQMGQLSQMMGGIQNMVASGGGGGGGGGGGSTPAANVTVQTILGQFQNGTATEDQLLAAFGGVTAMTAAFSQYLSNSDFQSIVSVLPGGQANSGG